VSELAELLQEGRRRERAQAAFYRALAGEAEGTGDLAAAERLNDLLADEQHHVSRLTARLLELGEKPGERVHAPDVPALHEWERAARIREAAEVAWYEKVLARVSEPKTRSVLEEILQAERHHHDVLAGKWMSAAPDDQGRDG
jgi:rubrerythrin